MKRMNKKGEMYVDVAVETLIFVFCALIALGVFGIVRVRQDLAYICEEVLKTATRNGALDERTLDRFDELSSGMVPKPELYCEAEMYDESTGKVQYGDVITVSVSASLRLPHSAPFGVTVKRSGLSDRYWK